MTKDSKAKEAAPMTLAIHPVENKFGIFNAGTAKPLEVCASITEAYEIRDKMLASKKD